MTSDGISLEEFILEMMRVPGSDLTLTHLEDLFRRLVLPEKLVDQHVNFSPSAYTRNLLCRTPRFDMLVLCWKPGHVTTIHDHTGSLGIARPCHGKITNKVYEILDDPQEGRVPVRLVEECPITSDSFCSVDRSGVHLMANESGEEAVTVHVYASPLQSITVYDLEAGTSEVINLRYSLEEEFG